MQIDDEFVKEYDGLICDRIAKSKINQDLFDEVRALVYRRILESDNYDPDKGALSTWIYMICRSVISNTYKKHQASKDALDQNCVDLEAAKNRIGDEDAGDPADELSRIFKATNVSTRDKNITRDVYLDGYTALEVAQKYRMTHHAVQKVLVRTLKALRLVAQDNHQH